MIGARYVIIAVLALLVLPGHACAPPAHLDAPRPLEVLLAWQGALRAERPRAAWALLDEGARDGLTENDFVRLFARDKAALIRSADDAVAWARAHPPSERALVSVGGAHFILIWTREGWRVDGAASRDNQEEKPRVSD